MLLLCCILAVFSVRPSSFPIRSPHTSHRRPFLISFFAKGNNSSKWTQSDEHKEPSFCFPTRKTLTSAETSSHLLRARVVSFSHRYQNGCCSGFTLESKISTNNHLRDADLHKSNTWSHSETTRSCLQQSHYPVAGCLHHFAASALFLHDCPSHFPSCLVLKNLQVVRLLFFKKIDTKCRP